MTIGHSNQETAGLLDLLAQHGVEMVIDVRSWPGSRRLPQFNKAALEAALRGAGIGYEWRGEALGGKPRDPGLTDGTGKPDYTAMAAQPAFEEAVDELAGLASSHRIALMCAEGDPAHCHRTHLVGAALTGRGVEVIHILRDGTLCADCDLPGRAPPAQGELFG